MKKQLFLFLAFTFFALRPVAQTVNGVDISHWNGTVNWATVYAAAKSFSYVKSTEGVNSNDAVFITNMTSSNPNGVKLGAYHVGRPDYSANNTATNEANHFLTIAGSYTGNGFLPPALDMEPAYIDAYIADGNSYNQLAQWIDAWCSIVQSSSSKWPVLYTTKCYAANLYPYYQNGTIDSHIKLWIATNNISTDPAGSPGTTSCGEYWSGWPWVFHQYYAPQTAGSNPTTYTDPGMDQDVFNGTLNDFNNLIGGGNCVASSIDPPSDGSGPNDFSSDFIFTATQPGCNFTITESSGCGFVDVTDPSSLSGIANQGGGNQYIIEYSVQANSTTSSRVCTLTVGGQTHVITQGGCDPDFNRNTLNNVSAAGETKTNTSADAGNAPCDWTIQVGCNWVSVDKTSGTNDYDLTIIIEPNPDCAPRSCTLDIRTPGAASSNDLVINQNAGNSSLTVNISPSNPTVCPGGSISLSASGASSYSWSTGGTSSSISISSQGTYSVTGTSNGCTGTASVNVTQSNTLNVAISPSNPVVCQDSTVTLTASGAATYSWSNGSSTQSINVQAGTYSVTGISGSCNATASVTATQISCPTSIKELTSLTDIAIFPNPNTGSFTIQLENRTQEEIQISVLNILGQSVYQAVPEQVFGEYSKSVELNSVASGVYFVKVRVGDEFANQKIIVR